MSIRDLSAFSINPSELPTWRKGVLSVAISLFLVTGGTITFKELRIYESAPSVPIASTQQVYGVYVMHGQQRYVTRSEQENFIFWKQRIGTLVGIPFIVGFLVLATARKGN
jgi:hypothetical protein